MKRVTMKLIAEQVGVSINAVSLALANRAGVSEGLRAKITQTAYDVGYFDDKSAGHKNAKQKNLLVILKNQALNDVHFHNVVFTSMQSEAKRQGYDIIVEFSDNLTQLPSSITDFKVAGVFTVGTFADEGLSAIQKTRIPMVLVNHETYLLDVDTIVNKNYQGAYLAFLHLYQNGHRKIGYVGHSGEESSLRLRKAGFLQAALDHQIYGQDFLGGYQSFAFEEDLTPFLMVHNTQAIAERLLAKYSSVQNLPSAIFCHNDATAIGVIKALTLLNVRVPTEVSVVSFDNIPLAQTFSPRLTTIDIPIRTMGARAIQQMIARLENKQKPCETILLPMRLLQRDSVCEFK